MDKKIRGSLADSEEEVEDERLGERKLEDEKLSRQVSIGGDKMVIKAPTSREQRKIYFTARASSGGTT